MAIDFSNPLTWHEEMSDADALNLAIFAINTILEPSASDQHSLDVLEHFAEDALERLVLMRDDADDLESEALRT